jgi:hypothetical protein
MLVIDNIKGEIVEEKIPENIKYESVIKTDNYSSYSKWKQ